MGHKIAGLGALAKLSIINNRTFKHYLPILVLVSHVNLSREKYSRYIPLDAKINLFSFSLIFVTIYDILVYLSYCPQDYK